ncbi:MAG: hypothetical protein V2A66_04065 [Pseudomonadota bacterium]
MRLKRCLFAGALGLAMIFFGATLVAQSLSDMDMSSLESQTSGHEGKLHSNPFSKGAPSAEEMAPEDLQLTGIIYRNEGNAYALVSGYLVRPGDRIAGYKVDTIEKSKVKLRRLDEVIVLSLGGGI